MILDRIDQSRDVKKLSIAELRGLAEEIRGLLLAKASAVGGHLASNLGMVEIAVAIHHVFDLPSDQVVFDVSHQCYTHKILSGRKAAFLEPERYGEVTGFTNPEESDCDLFNIGHTSTAISLACGLAKAK